MEPLTPTDSTGKPKNEATDDTAKAFDSVASPASAEAGKVSSAWRRVATVAGASAILGGLAAAWWYRSTLLKLRQAEESNSHSDFGKAEEEPTEEE